MRSLEKNPEAELGTDWRDKSQMALKVGPMAIQEALSVHNYNKKALDLGWKYISSKRKLETLTIYIKRRNSANFLPKDTELRLHQS